MNKTLHYKFPLFEGGDIPSIIRDWNTTVSKLDTKLYELSLSGDSEEIIEELDRIKDSITALSNSLLELTHRVDSIEDLTDDIQGLVIAVRNLSEQIDIINRAVRGKLDRLNEYSFPVPPVVDEQHGWVVKIPYMEKEGNTPPSEFFQWSKWVAFYYASWNDVQFTVELPDGNLFLLDKVRSWRMYRGSQISIRTWVDSEETTHQFWAPMYVDISSSYTLPQASPNTLGGVKVGQGLSIESDGTLNASASISILKRLKGYGSYDYVPVEYSSDGQEMVAHKAVPVSFTVTLQASGSKGLTIYNNYPIIGSFTIRDLIENPSLFEPWTYDNTKDRLCATNNAISFSLGSVTSQVVGVMQSGYYKDRPELTLYARYALPDIGTLPVPLCKVQIWVSENEILLYPTENLADAASALYNQYRAFPLPTDIDAQIELSLQLTDIKVICDSIDSTGLGDYTISGNWYVGLARFN